MSDAAQFQVSETRDIAVIDGIFRELEPMIRVDQVPLVSVAPAVTDPRFMFVAVEETGCLRGIVMIFGNELHTLFRDTLRGRRALRAGHAVLSWIWGHTTFDELTSYAFSNRPDVLWFARQMGFAETETRDDGYTVRGTPVTTTMLRILRPCLPQSL